jgi:hypothetical protein
MPARGAGYQQVVQEGERHDASRTADAVQNADG